MPGGVLLDIDGVLTVSWEPLPGAVDTMRWLGSHDVPFRLVTNTSSKSRAEIAELLADAGMPVDPERILTAVVSADRLLDDRFPERACFVVNEGNLELSHRRSADPAEAEVVLLGGAGSTVTYDDLNAAFRLALHGAPVVALHRNTRFQRSDGPALDMGAFIAGLEAAADVDVIVVGKPAAEFFDAALTDLGVDASNAVMVGDDINSDVLGAQVLGLTGVLVRTGKFRPSDLDGDARPDHVIDTIGDLPGLITGR